VLLLLFVQAVPRLMFVVPPDDSFCSFWKERLQCGNEGAVSRAYGRTSSLGWKKKTVSREDRGFQVVFCLLCPVNRSEKAVRTKGIKM